MAIIFTTGTINQPDAGSVGLAMVEKIRDDVAAHPAWDVVDEYTAASGTVRWYVLKCLASQSGMASDFFVVLCRRLSDGYLQAFICETYNPASHIAQHFPPAYIYSQNVVYDASGRNGLQFTLADQPVPSSGNTPSSTYWAPSGTSTKWWITVASDGFTVAFNGGSNAFMHFGAYTPLTSVPIPFPLTMMGRNMINSNGMITRNPTMAGITFYGTALSYNGGEGAGINGQALGFSGDLRYNDKLQNDQRPVAECGMCLMEYTVGDRAIQGYALGKQKRMRWTTSTVPTAMAFGDAFVLNNTLWVPFYPGDARMWDTGVPSS
jgi:hypothetical protein